MDPLYQGSDESKDIQFGSGKKVLSHLKSLVEDNKPIDDVILGDKEVVGHFQRLFPQIIDSNATSQVKKQDFGLWEHYQNSISITLDKADMVSEVAYDVYIGGPAAAVGAALQAKSGQSPHKVLYGHDGKRGRLCVYPVYHSFCSKRSIFDQKRCF